jgi:hypothetical protein
VLAAKSVMQQSLFDEEVPAAPVMNLAPLFLALAALLVALFALGVVLFR